MLVPHPDTDVLESVDANVVGAGFFNTMQIPIVEGRGFTSEDASGAQTIVVDQAFVDAHWPGERGVGRSVRLGEGALAGPRGRCCSTHFSRRSLPRRGSRPSTCRSPNTIGTE